MKKFKVTVTDKPYGLKVAILPIIEAETENVVRDIALSMISYYVTKINPRDQRGRPINPQNMEPAVTIEELKEEKKSNLISEQVIEQLRNSVITLADKIISLEKIVNKKVTKVKVEKKEKSKNNTKK